MLDSREETVMLSSHRSKRFAMLALLAGIASLSASLGVRAADQNAPRLSKQGTATQLMVDGKQFLPLGGVVSDASAPNWASLTQTNANTAVTPVSWKAVEPSEGQFDFAAVDGLLKDAQANKMKLVIQWQGGWNNGTSFTPAWVKADAAAGSPLGDARCDVDSKAFATLMKHLARADDKHTVVAVQVENKAGVAADGATLDRLASGAAAKELMDYLTTHKDTLTPELRTLWDAAGNKTSGTWKEVFGDGAGEIAMAWMTSQYVGRVAAAGKAAYAIPLVANCSVAAADAAPEGIPIGQPLAHLLDVWHAGAPAIDMISPEITAPNFAAECAKFTRDGSPLFLPAVAGTGAGPQALYAIGKFNAIGAAAGADATGMANMFSRLNAMAPAILENQGMGTITAVMFGPGSPDEAAQQLVVTLEKYTLTFTPGGGGGRGGRGGRGGGMMGGGGRGGAGAVDTGGVSAGIWIALTQEEFLILHTGVTGTVSANDPSLGTLALGFVENGSYIDGKWTRYQRINGDENNHDRNIGSGNGNSYSITHTRYYQRP
jgi:hypothetical protein